MQNDIQSSELSKVKARILALSLKTVSNGCSEAEANSAMEKVGELLQVYNLNMSEIEMKDERFVTISISFNGLSKDKMKWVVCAIAAFCDCKVWFDKGSKVRKTNSAYSFFGMEPDTEMVKYLYSTIEKSMTHELAQYKNTPYMRAIQGTRGMIKVASTNFITGFCTKVNARLNQIKGERDDALRAAKQAGTSLVVIKSQLVEERFREEGISLRKNYTPTYRRQYDFNAYYAGSDAGEKVNFNRPVGSEGRNQLKLA